MMNILTNYGLGLNHILSYMVDGDKLTLCQSHLPMLDIYKKGSEMWDRGDGTKEKYSNFHFKFALSFHKNLKKVLAKGGVTMFNGVLHGDHFFSTHDPEIEIELLKFINLNFTVSSIEFTPIGCGLNTARSLMMGLGLNELIAFKDSDDKIVLAYGDKKNGNCELTPDLLKQPLEYALYYNDCEKVSRVPQNILEELNSVAKIGFMRVYKDCTL